MAAGFYWYPEPLGTVESINLGRAIQERDGPHVILRQTVAESFTGNQVTTRFGGRERIRIRVEGLTDRTVRQKLVAMIRHLQAGGTIGFAEDVSKAWAGFAVKPVSRGDTDVFVTTNAFYALAPAATPADRELILFGPNPTFLYEMNACTSYTATGGDRKVTLQSGLAYDWVNQDWLFLRELGSYPALRLPKESRNGEFLRNDREQNFSLDLPLESNPVSFDVWATQYDAILTGTDPGGFDPNAAANENLPGPQGGFLDKYSGLVGI